MSAGQRTRVLIVDDSAFMRKVLQSIIAADPQMEVVGEARDGREAVSLNESLNPDVISMDINMPHMDGLQASEAIMARNPRPIVIVSSEARDGAEATLRALEIGAIDFVPKPTNAIDLDMNSVRDELCRKLKVASRVRVVRTIRNSNNGGGNNGGSNGTAPAPSAKPVASVSAPVAPTNGTSDAANGRFPIIVVAASTGGPQTLMNFVPMFPHDFLGAVILVQHMPGTFTSQFAHQLAEVAKIRVKEAQHGEMVQPGVFYVCPGSHHLRITPQGRIALDEGERINGYRPCADVTLETAAAYTGPMTTGIILTGMGSDGAKGSQSVKASGGHVIAQDEVTSVIFGMPAEAIKTGAVDQVLGIDAIVPAVEKRVLYLMGAARVGAM
jgi:two-component system, chemotaxis family, protein-glutamate methylesterase/glutaminase